MRVDTIVERGILPDPILRMGIRRLLKSRLETERAKDPAEVARRRALLVEDMRSSPIGSSSGTDPAGSGSCRTTG